jgi:hypothetical protein
MNKIPNKDRTLAPDREGIFKALDAMCDALHLGRAESSTAELFDILADAFSSEPVSAMFDLLDESHEDGLCYDMRGPMTDSILRAHANNLEAPLYEN